MECQFVNAWSKTMGVLALSSGDSELAAFVRAATESSGFQSILNDFDLCGHVAIKSDATPAIGMVHPLGLGTFGCRKPVDSASLWFRENSRHQNVAVGVFE